MESWTPEHNRYLSCLLDHVTGTEEMVKIRQDYCKMHDYVRSINSSNSNVYYTGSKAEGLELADSDKDCMYDINRRYDVDVSESIEDLRQSTCRNKLLIEYDNAKPGFVFLKCISVQNDHLLRSIVNIGDNSYLSSQNFLSSSPCLHVSLESEICRKPTGPSVESWSKYSDIKKSGRDNVHSILCRFWPTSAIEWKNRPRKYGWPHQHDKEFIEQFGCHLVPIGHPLSILKSLEWRLSFSIAERTLVWSFNHTQLQCYAVMKLILKEFVKVECTEKHHTVLCSYFIKSFLFWEFESTNPLFWQTDNLIGCIMYLLHAFQNCIKTGVLRHYFVPSFNLFEIKLTQDAKNEFYHIFSKVTEMGISVLGLCNSMSEVFAKFLRVKNSIHCAERTVTIIKTSIIGNGEQMMKYASQLLFDINNVLNIRQCDIKMGRYEKYILHIIKHIREQQLSTHLSFFVIRRLWNLISTAMLYDNVHRSNKHTYYYMKSLGCNVFGTDIASSKLWLATFLLHQGDHCGSLQTISDVLSSIPPYALYTSLTCVKTNDDSNQLYIDAFCSCNTDILYLAKEAWLIDMHISHREYSFVPRAIQIELDYCDPKAGVFVSPFTYAYYLMFLCYHGQGQYDNKDRALRQMVDTISDENRCCLVEHHSYNIEGHCMLISGYVEKARKMFLESAKYTNSRQSPEYDKHNAAYAYLSLM